MEEGEISVILDGVAPTDEIVSAAESCGKKSDVLESKGVVTSAITILLTFVGISLAAYVGVFIRIGVSFYKIWKIESNFTVMYTQILGCILMGFVSRHKLYMNGDISSRLSRVIYITITSGLCGSITTFSSWQWEVNKSFMLQWDTTWGNYYGTYNGGRLMEWAVGLWVGVALPLMALHLGHHLALLSPHHNDSTTIHSTTDEAKVAVDTESNTTHTPSGRSPVFESSGEVLLVCSFAVITVLIILLPLYLGRAWLYLTYAALMGACGASLRYILSFQNATSPEFPLGTFIANVAGSWLVAALMVVSKFGVDYYNVDAQAVLSGLVTGFCGCLTTVSTFVAEIDSLPLAASYKYGLASNLVAQLGIVLIADIYSFRSVALSAAGTSPPPLQLCPATYNLCDVMLTALACPAGQSRNTPCGVNGDSYYSGKCGCGDQFATVRLGDLLVDSQVRANATFNLAAVWPAAPEDSRDPGLELDYCITFQNVCDNYLTRTACPRHRRVIDACGRRGILHARSRCNCGEENEDDAYSAGARVAQVISDVALNRGTALAVYTGYVSVSHFDFPAAYEDVCHAVLGYMQCPPSYRRVTANAVQGEFGSWVGECTCGSRYIVNSNAVASSLYAAVVKPYVAGLLVPLTSNGTSSTMVWDVCNSYLRLCGHWLDKISCPAPVLSACGTSANGTGVVVSESNRTLLDFSARCECGQLTSLSSAVTNSIIDAVTAQTLSANFWQLPLPAAPYSLMAGTNPMKQLFAAQTGNSGI